MEGKHWNQWPWPPSQACQGYRTERSALSKNCLQSGLQSCQDRSYSRRECQQEGRGPRSWQTAPSLIPDQAPGPSADCEEMTASKTPDSSTSKVHPHGLPIPTMVQASSRSRSQFISEHLPCTGYCAYSMFSNPPEILCVDVIHIYP